jgi:pimeloyl-ACP methyl ester carboxylesterase
MGFLTSLGSNRRGWAILLGIAVAAGLISAGLTPRGPVTTTEALISMGVAFGAGVVAGLIATNRWSLWVLPVVFVAVFELPRINLTGPTVDGLHLGSTYGIIAFIVGRLWHGVLVFVPLGLGLLHGIRFRDRLRNIPAPAISRLGWIITNLATVALIGFGLWIDQPATTAPITDANGAPLSGSIAELSTVAIGGHPQTVMIRGNQQNAPVLLYLAGGPGGTDLGAMRADTRLEQDFVVATWDQRGTGKSYPALDPVETLTLDQMVQDTLELTDYLRNRFDQEQIYLVGNSWGTILGTLAVQQQPESFRAYVGTGQMVSPRETDIRFYEDTLTWAEKIGDDALVSTLKRNGPPPYENILNYEPALSHEHEWNPYPRLGTSEEMPFNLLVPENTVMDRINAMRGLLDTFSVLYPQLQEIDFRRDVPELNVPVYMVLGKYEARGRAVLANEWFAKLTAPVKETIIFEQSGHRPLFEEPGAFAELMVRILADT